MATRQATLTETFDPATFHRSATMAQSGWAEHELRESRKTSGTTLRRYAGIFTLALGTLLVAALRPADLLDGRDLIVSSVALLASLFLGIVVTRVAMRMTTSSPEIDRIVTWSVALLAGMILVSTGAVATFSRDAGDFISDIPGYTMTASPELRNLELQSLDSELFADVGLWSLQRDEAVAGSLGVFLIADEGKVSSLGQRKFLSQALHEPGSNARSNRLAGKEVFIASSGGQTQVGWLDGSAVLVLSGGNRIAILDAAAALIRERR